MELGQLEVEFAQFGVADHLSGWIDAPIQFGANLQAHQQGQGNRRRRVVEDRKLGKAQPEHLQAGWDCFYAGRIRHRRVVQEPVKQAKGGLEPARKHGGADAEHALRISGQLGNRRSGRLRQHHSLLHKIAKVQRGASQC